MKIASTLGRGIITLAWLGLAACATSAPEPAPDLDKLTAGVFVETGREALPQGYTPRPLFDRGLALTKASEGFVPRLYNDAAGFCTVAYGHLIKKTRCDGSEPAEFVPKVSEAQGGALLVTDLANAQYAVETKVRNAGQLTDGQYAALVDFAFNVGGSAMGRSTLLRLVNARRYDQVPAEWRKWVGANGKVYPGLVTRREREIALFIEGLPASRAAPSEDESSQVIDIRVGG